MFLFVLAKLLPERHNLYGNSLDLKLKIYERKKLEEEGTKELSGIHLPCPALAIR